jgi:hypothetical protein
LLLPAQVLLLRRLPCPMVTLTKLQSFLVDWLFAWGFFQGFKMKGFIAFFFFFVYRGLSPTKVF